MIVGLAVISLVVVTLLIACSTSAPANPRTRSRHLDRRARYVLANPQSASPSDILSRLRRDGVADDQARFILDRAARLEIKPFTMWLWLQQFDAAALGLVVAADLTTEDLLGHICRGTVPDVEELRVFAELNGIELAGPVVRRREPVERGRTTLTRSHPLPAIFEPGTLPGGGRLSLRGIERPSDGLPRLGDRKGRDDLAA